MLMQMPGPRDIVIYWPGPRAFSVVQKPWDWAHISVQKPRAARGHSFDNVETVGCLTPSLTWALTPISTIPIVKHF